MTEQILTAPARTTGLIIPRRTAVAVGLWIVLLVNVAAIVWLWVHGGNLTDSSPGAVLTSIARLTGLLSAFLALLQVVLLARIPLLERLVGFDRLSVWHRWNGHACIDLVIAHVVFSVWGYALLDRYSLPKELTTMLGGGIYPGMITATIGTAFLLGVVASSVVIVRRRLRYEWWYAVHLLAYVGIALAWFHQIPTGNELVLDRAAADYWRALFYATFAFLVIFRVLVPLVAALRYRLRVVDVVEEAPGIVSLRIEGRALERLQARAGQFFLWRFLTPGRWWSAHPFSLSEVPVGTRVLAEGPFGVFTQAARRREKVALIAGGIGITPIRALVEEMHGDIVVLYRAIADDELVFRSELSAIAAARGIVLHYVVGDHATDEGARLLNASHLRELVPDIAQRDVYVCGPPAMTDTAVRHLRAAGVARRHIHAERFSL
jgi:predicted ferric reductase